MTIEGILRMSPAASIESQACCSWLEMFRLGIACQGGIAGRQVRWHAASLGMSLTLCADDRLDMAYEDWHSVKAGLKAANELCASGGDWERKNRLKVYEASYLMATRDLAGAAKLFLDSIATFTS